MDPVPDPILPKKKILRYSRESDPGPLGWESDVLTTIPNRILHHKNRENTKLKFNSCIYFRDINLIDFNMQISKCCMCIKFLSKIFLKNLKVFQDMV